MLIVRDIIFDSNIPSLFEAKSFGKSSPRYPNGGYSNWNFRMYYT